MTLPILTANKFSTIIPSTGATIQFRPFLVREEKILLLAQESGEDEQIIQSLKDIIRACTFEKIDVESLATYDIEHLFIQLRAKSVGELIDLQMPCKACKKIMQIEINLNDVKVTAIDKTVSSKIQLSDGVGMTVRAVPVAEMANVSSKSEDFEKTLALCVETIYDDKKVWSRADMDPAELIEFIASLNRHQVAEIEKFIAAQPKLHYEKTVICSECKVKNEIVLNGLQDFFQSPSRMKM